MKRNNTLRMISEFIIKKRKRTPKEKENSVSKGSLQFTLITLNSKDASMNLFNESNNKTHQQRFGEHVIKQIYFCSYLGILFMASDSYIITIGPHK